MNNTSKGTGRTVIVSDFMICPIDPIEFKYEPIPKCYGQMIVDNEAKTITFKHTGGTAPGIYQVLAAMFINKNWTKLMKDPANKKEIKNGFLLFADNGKRCYLAKKSENGLPVITKKLDYRRNFINELTFTLCEFYHFLIDETLLPYYFCCRKQQLIYIKKEFSFKYITAQEAQSHINDIKETISGTDDDDFIYAENFYDWGDWVQGYEDFDDEEEDFVSSAPDDNE